MSGMTTGSDRLSIARRFMKFALVGAVGIAVQLALLEVFTGLGCHYLPATGLAVEAAVLHNFLWHQRFTWIDRAPSHLTETCFRLLRFHISNGAISIVGSLLLMRWFVGELGIGVIAANLLTIAACSSANFLASDRLVFLAPSGAAMEK